MATSTLPCAAGLMAGGFLLCFALGFRLGHRRGYADGWSAALISAYSASVRRARERRR